MRGGDINVCIIVEICRDREMDREGNRIHSEKVHKLQAVNYMAMSDFTNMGKEKYLQIDKTLEGIQLSGMEILMDTESQFC